MKPSTFDDINEYVKEKHPLEEGEFLYAVLSNNLVESFKRADEENKRDLEEIVQYCYWYIPAESWGSPEKVRNWVKVSI